MSNWKEKIVSEIAKEKMKQGDKEGKSHHHHHRHHKKRTSWPRRFVFLTGLYTVSWPIYRFYQSY